MKEAIEKFRLGATTVTKRSDYLPYEAPSLIICPEPGFKQSVFKRYNMTLPARYVFQDNKYLKALFSKIQIQTRGEVTGGAGNAIAQPTFRSAIMIHSNSTINIFG